MTVPDFTYALNGISGKPSAKLEVLYTQDSPQAGATSPAELKSSSETANPAVKAELILHLSESLPSAQREESLNEYLKLSEVLGLPSRLNAEKTSLAIEVGAKSPEALMMFITGDLEQRALVHKAESKQFMATMLAREESTHSAPHMPDPMQAALAAAHSQGAVANLKEAGVALGSHKPQSPPQHNVASTAKPVSKNQAQIV